jgi:ABC-type multidrug transport system permease subunit
MCEFRGSFIFIVLAGWGLGVASSSVAIMLGCALNDVRDVQEMAPLLFVPQFLFAGFFVATSAVPQFLRWSQYLCSVKYALNLILITEFDASLPSCSGENAANCENILHINDVDPSKWWVYMLVLIALFIGFRLIAAMLLVRRAQRYF